MRRFLALLAPPTNGLSNNLDVTPLDRLQKHNELNKLSIFVRIDKLVARMLVMVRLVFEVLFFRPAHLVRRGYQ